MKNKNSQKGITIIALVITVIMLLILASVATYTGIESYDKAEQIWTGPHRCPAWLKTKA